MNERIRELAEKANIKFGRMAILDGDPRGMARLVTYSNFEKFSELLITAVMAEVRDEIQCEYDWTLADIVTERVKKAFGVTQ
jgi:hypothetical protein